jgi:hypothetical protein
MHPGTNKDKGKGDAEIALNGHRPDFESLSARSAWRYWTVVV